MIDSIVRLPCASCHETIEVDVDQHRITCPHCGKLNLIVDRGQNTTTLLLRPAGLGRRETLAPSLPDQRKRWRGLRFLSQALHRKMALFTRTNPHQDKPDSKIKWCPYSAGPKSDEP